MNTFLITIPVTAGRETRDVVFEGWIHADGGQSESAYSTEPVGLFTKGFGNKQWPWRISAWRQKDGSWKISTNATILNRNGYRLIGFADQVRNESQHNSAY